MSGQGKPINAILDDYRITCLCSNEGWNTRT
jgi:hypothetical protein